MIYRHCFISTIFGFNNKNGDRKAKYNLPTTSRKPVWLFIGSVFIWHMYQPRSVSRTSRMCKNQVRWSLWVTPILWFFVITWFAIVRIVWVSTRSHATWNNILLLILFYFCFMLRSVILFKLLQSCRKIHKITVNKAPGYCLAVNSKKLTIICTKLPTILLE